MEYTTYHYHGCKGITKPRKTTANIKGLELEISDYDASDILDSMVEDNILTVPANEDERKEQIICIEDDGSVYKELIFKASCNNTLLRGVKKVAERLHGEIYNSHGTSCHIHINNAHLKDKNIKQFEIVKATEFIAPILFEISGRNYNAYEQWARSGINHLIDIHNTDLYKRSKLIDTELEQYNGRYSTVNCCDKTTEIRIFSNYYNFNYDYIKLYIESVDFIIKLAEKMQHKSYRTEYNKAIKLVKEFFSQRKYKNIYEDHSLEIFFASAKERQLIELNKEIRYFKRKINHLKDIMIVSENMNDKRQNAIELLRILRDYSNKYNLSQLDINLYNFNIDEIQEMVISRIEEKIIEVEAQEE